MKVLLWGITVLSIVGVILNIKKIKWSFACWIVTNFAWMVIDYVYGLTSQAFLFLIYFLLAIYGLWEWRKNPPDKSLRS